MSRRTKLIIAAVFLVLLGIPAAYVAVTWTPHEPPRFRLISVSPAPANDPGSLGTCVVEIENRSFIPIEMSDPDIVLMMPEELRRTIDAPNFASLDFVKIAPDPFMLIGQLDESGGKLSSWEGLVRGRQRIRLQLHLMMKPPFRLIRKGASVHYSWRSQTRKRWVELLDTLRTRFPDWMMRFRTHDGFSQDSGELDIPDSLVSQQASPSRDR